LATQTAPTTLKQTVLAMIPKAGGDLTQPKGWRYIALMNTCAKLYDRLLLNRILDPILAHMRPNQAGFLPHRSTIQQAMALKMIIEHFDQHKHTSGVVTFIDFSNAFPSITRVAIREALKAFRVPDLLIGAILSVYADHQAWVKTPYGETKPFSPTAGVLQGDTLAPFLFDVVLDRLLWHALDNNPLAIGLTVADTVPPTTDLDYADDIALLAPNLKIMQNMLDSISLWAKRAGLLMNPVKTKAMFIGEVPLSYTPLVVGDTTLEMVKDYRYLGCHMNTDLDIRERKGQAWKIMQSFANAWKSPAVSDANKIRLWRAMVEPVITYGIPTYTLTVRRQLLLRGTVTNMLKIVLGIRMEDHTSLEDIYGITCATTLNSPKVDRDLPQITTTGVLRQLNCLASMAIHVPSHLVLQMLKAKTKQKLRAGRSWSLRKSIEIAMQMQSTKIVRTLKSLVPTPVALKQLVYNCAQHHERQAIIQTHRMTARERLRDKLQKILKEHMEELVEEDLPIIDTTWFRVKRFRQLEGKVEFLDIRKPGLLPPNFLAELQSEQLVLHMPPPSTAKVSIRMCVSRLAIRSVHPPSSSETEENAPPTSDSGQSVHNRWQLNASSISGTSFHLSMTSQFSNKQKAEAELLLKILTAHPKHQLTIFTTSKSLIAKTAQLSVNYYHRQLRKHILWKTLFLTLRDRVALGSLVVLKKEE
jgi:hypothetical protein